MALLVAREPRYGLRVLFVGNSYVSVNDLPGMVAAIAASKGDRVETGMAAPGGYRLSDHAGDPATLAAIRRGWDVVVLQEQSQLPAVSDERGAAEVAPAALALARDARNAHARPLFYETWARRDGDPDMQARIARTYRDLAARSSADVAPVGDAWARVRAAHPEIELYGPDGSHPSPEGTYLAACVFYDTLFDGTSRGADAPGIDPGRALVLQEAADRR